MTCDPGERVVKFVKKLRLTGDFRGKPFELLPFQERWFRTIYGTIGDDGFRSYTKGSLFLPRKCGKSSLVAGSGVYHLFGEAIGKGGQEIYSAASNKEQAGRIYKYIKETIEQNKYLSSQIKFYDQPKVIAHRKLENVFKSLASDGGPVHGLNPSVIYADELHAWKPSKARDLWAALKTGSGTRSEPLFITLTTVGDDLTSVCHEEYQYAKKVLADPRHDPEYYPVVYELAIDDAWDCEDNWYKCNPALGKFVHIRELRKLFNEAKLLPEREASFRQFQLNQWVQGCRKWLPVDRWDKLKGTHTFESMKGKKCYAGLDLATISDLVSLVLLFPSEDGSGIYRTLNINWISGENAKKRGVKDGVPYLTWKQTHPESLRFTSGDTTSHDEVEKDVIEICKQYNVELLAIDPDNACMMSEHLKKAGIKLESYYQSMSWMNAPSKQLERLLIDGRIHNDGNPVMRWCIGNVVAEKDNQDRIRPSRRSSDEKVDCVVALIMALGVSMSEQESPTIYNDREIRFV